MALRWLAALVSGAVLLWVAPPANLHFVHWFSFLPLFWALRAGEGRRNLKLAYAAGWIAQFLIFWWLIGTIVLFSNIPWVLALLLHLVFATAFALPYALAFGATHWFRARFGLAWIALLPAWLVAVEQLFPQLFPYYQGAAQYRATWVWQLASAGGVMAVSYLVILVNAALAEVIYRRREGRPVPWKALAAVAAVFLANLAWGAWRTARVDAALAEAPTLRVALMQQDTTMQVRLAQTPLESLRSWMRLTRKAAPEHPDLVVWPEGAISFNPHDETVARVLGNRSPRTFFEDLAREGNFDLLIGGGTIEEGPGDSYTAYNSAYEFRRDGRLWDRYDKIVPLPFGEYIPFADTFPWLKELIQGPGDFRAGTRTTVFTTSDSRGDTYTFTAPICYEAILQGLMVKMFRGEDPGPPGPPFANPGARGPVDLFVNITNDAWFGDTHSPYQHAMLAAAQATQFGRPLVRVAYTGIDFVVEPDGRILHETRPFEEKVQVVPVRMGRFDTLYARGGRFFSWFCVLVSAAAWIVGRRRAVTPGSGPA